MAAVVDRLRRRLLIGVCETALRASFFLTAVAVAGAAASAALPPSIASDLVAAVPAAVGEFSSRRLVDRMPRNGVDDKKPLILFLALLRRSVGVCGSVIAKFSLLLSNATS